MTDGEALFRAILDDPDDDLPRLAYADWLEENGRQPRAQLIRLMCEAARLAPSREPAERRRFEEATAEYCSLLVQHEAEWLAELPKLDGLEWGMSGEKNRFGRGFVHAITARDWRTPVAAGERALAASPVEWLRVRLLSAKGLASWLGLTRFSRLDLSGSLLDNAAATTLRASPHLGRLRWLQISGTRFSAGAVASLIRAGWFANVERLEAQSLTLGAGGPDATPLPPRPRLRYLDLSQGHLTALILPLVSVETFPNLARLHLRSCELLDWGVNQLASNEAARSLRHLDLRHNGLTDDGARALADSDRLDGLEFLDLRQNPRIEAAGRRLLHDRFDHDDCRLLLDGEGQP